MMKISLLALGLLLLSREADANEDWLARCGKHLIHVWGHHGFVFTLMPPGTPENLQAVERAPSARPLPKRQFRLDDDGNLYFRGRRCERVDDIRWPEK
jgi:hypothetical protein